MTVHVGTADLIKMHEKRQMHIHQNLDEFAVWINKLRDLKPKYVLDIGTYFFGTAQMMLEFVPSIKLLYTVDHKVLDVDRKSRMEALYPQQLVVLTGSTFSEEIWQRIPSIDAAFIDGDHTFLGKVNDFYRVRRIMWPDGLIGMHDVANTADGGICAETTAGTRMFWEGLSKSYPDQCETIMRDTEPWGQYGIGIFRKI